MEMTIYAVRGWMEVAKKIPYPRNCSVCDKESTTQVEGSIKSEVKKNVNWKKYDTAD